MANYTTMHVGGPADLLLVVQGIQELIEAVRAAQVHQVPWRVLGGGSNLLVADAGISGLVIINKANQIEFRAAGEVYAESGASLAGLARACVGRGLAGLEWAVGVPGTVGGAVVGNAGAHGVYMADTLQSGTVLEPDACGMTAVERPLEWFQYGYRSSRLKRVSSGENDPRQVVLAATFRLSPGNPEELKQRCDYFLARRKRSQPPGASMGSTFKNPPGDKAGRLIEAAGLKGTRVGGAEVSPLHANFIINQGEARASDVKALIDLVQERVWREFGVRLELEIELIGNW